MIFLVQCWIYKHLLIFVKIAFALRTRAILLVFEKILQVLIYFKLHSKSCDYLNGLHVNDSLLPIT